MIFLLPTSTGELPDFWTIKVVSSKPIPFCWKICSNPVPPKKSHDTALTALAAMATWHTPLYEYDTVLHPLWWRETFFQVVKDSKSKDLKFNLVKLLKQTPVLKDIKIKSIYVRACLNPVTLGKNMFLFMKARQINKPNPLWTSVLAGPNT